MMIIILRRLNVVGGDNVYSIKTLELVGEAALGMLVAVPWHILPSGDRTGPIQLIKVVTGNRSRTGYDFEPIR